MKNRKKELEKVCESLENDIKIIVFPMLDDIVLLETRLEELRKLPFIKINAQDNTMQKPTQASKQYKELLQQYNNCIKILCGVVGKKEGVEDSDLRKGLQKLYEKYE